MDPNNKDALFELAGQVQPQGEQLGMERLVSLADVMQEIAQMRKEMENLRAYCQLTGNLTAALTVEAQISVIDSLVARLEGLQPN